MCFNLDLFQVFIYKSSGADPGFGQGGGPASSEAESLPL